MANQGAYRNIGIEAGKLRSLAEELHSIAAAMVPHADVEPDGAEPSAMPADDPSDYTRLAPDAHAQMVELARRIYRSRRIRSRAFGDDNLFGEPAWDLLLDLFVAEADGKQLSVTAACIGASVPTSTALRWLVILEERGLVRRENDTRDARRVFLHLTANGYARMTGYFRQLNREGVFGS